MPTFPEEKERRSGDLAWTLWWSRIRSCMRFRHSHLYGDTMWERYYRTYEGIQWEDIDDMYDISSDNLPEKVVVNVTASTILNIVPFLVNEQAQYNLEPRKPADVINAMLKQKVLNYEFLHRNIQSELKKVVYDGLIIGHGIAKTGFVRTIDKAATQRTGDIEYDDLIEDESVYCRRIDPRNFWFDYNAVDRNLDTARYTIERYFKYIPDLVENTSFKSSVREKIKDGTFSLVLTDSTPGNSFSENDLTWLNGNFDNFESEMATLYEIWDKKYNQVLTFVEGVVEPIRVIDNPYLYLKGEFPYSKFDFIYVPNQYYGCGIPRFIEAQQFELNRHRTFAFNHRRKHSARLYEVSQDVDPDEAEKLPEAEDGTYIIVPNIGSISPIAEAPLPRDYSLFEAIIKADIDNMTGNDALVRGQPLQSRATLGEVQTRSNILSLKLNDRVAEVDKLFLKVGKQLASHIGANYNKSLIVRLTGLQGEFWVEVNNEDLKDETDVSMTTVSAPRRNPEVQQQQRIQMFQFSMQLLPLIQAGVIPPDAINFVELLKWALEGFERQDIGRFFPSALTPISPLNQSLISSGEVSAQFQPQVEQALGGNAQDLVRRLSSGNLTGLQV